VCCTVGVHCSESAIVLGVGGGWGPSLGLQSCHGSDSMGLAGLMFETQRLSQYTMVESDHLNKSSGIRDHINRS
jgi:hypothetical protein